jgi:hypothetical protein
MKTILFCLFAGAVFCCLPTQPVPTKSATIAVAAPTSPLLPDTIIFAQQIQPILQNRCNPCHFPGGKMYEKMPFDQAKTLIEHQEGILKRFNDEGENKLLKQFIAEQPKK